MTGVLLYIFTPFHLCKGYIFMIPSFLVSQRLSGYWHQHELLWIALGNSHGVSLVFWEFDRCSLLIHDVLQILNSSSWLLNVLDIYNLYMESFLPHEDCETGTCWRWWEDAPFWCHAVGEFSFVPLVLVSISDYRLLYLAELTIYQQCQFIMLIQPELHILKFPVSHDVFPIALNAREQASQGWFQALAHPRASSLGFARPGIGPNWLLLSTMQKAEFM
jgi:hypothetical protein